MQIPTVRGVIERRLLVNYRVDPDRIAAILPDPFRPVLVGDRAIAGVCLIRLGRIRPRFVPSFLGVGSENAAHRIAVRWDEDGQEREGVYIPRRDTSSRLNAWVGGRIFPGLHHRARFDVEEGDGRYRVGLVSDDGATRVSVVGRVTDRLPAGSIFGSVEEASAFFEKGSLGYSATADPAVHDGLELRTRRWRVEPLEVESVASSFFDDLERFPEGTAAFDHALLMRDLDHEWVGRGEMVCPACAAT